MSVVCWYCNVQPLSDEALFSRRLSLLPWEERREKVMRFRFDKDRRLCLGTGLLLAYALRRAGASDLSLHTLPNGKPILANDPNIHFNLSHSGLLAVCAVSDHPVGVDVEPLRDAIPEVVTMCFQTAEQEWIKASDDPGYAFSRLWTRKESYLKLSGEGLSRPLDSFCVLPGKGAPKEAHFAESEEMGHLICVCTRQNDAVIFNQWEVSQP